MKYKAQYLELQAAIYQMCVGGPQLTKMQQKFASTKWPILPKGSKIFEISDVVLLLVQLAVALCLNTSAVNRKKLAITEIRIYLTLLKTAVTLPNISASSAEIGA